MKVSITIYWTFKMNQGQSQIGVKVRQELDAEKDTAMIIDIFTYQYEISFSHHWQESEGIIEFFSPLTTPEFQLSAQMS